jgi:hypothetical protein
VVVRPACKAVVQGSAGLPTGRRVKRMLQMHLASPTRPAHVAVSSDIAKKSSSANLLSGCLSPQGTGNLRPSLTRIFHESLAATTDMAVLPGVLGCWPLRRTVQVRLGTDPLRLPGTRRKRLRYAWHLHLRGLATSIHETSGLGGGDRCGAVSLWGRKGQGARPPRG